MMEEIEKGMKNMKIKKNIIDIGNKKKVTLLDLGISMRKFNISGKKHIRPRIRR